MDPEGGAPAAAREVRVEGVGLIVLGGVLLALLVGVFYAGFELGRGSSDSTDSTSSSQAAAGGEPAEPLRPSASEPAGVFDTVPEKGAAAEPGRQIVPPPRESTPPKSAPSKGDWFVQVFAGRDRRAAESVVSSLTAQGYPVQLDSKTEGRDALFKVRVGGFADEQGARAAMDRLRKDGQSGAWVTRAR